MSVPPDQVEKMDQAAFFVMFAEQMKENPPDANGYPILDRMKRIGIEPGKSFSLASAPPEIQEALKAAPDSALPAIKVAWRNSGAAVNGWKINLTAIGTYGAGVGAQPEIGGQRWPSRRFQASLRETGMPRAVMRLSTLQPTLASTFCAGRVRARSVRPMMVL